MSRHFAIIAIIVTLASSNGQEQSNGFARVVNGTDSDIARFPYLISLRRPDDDGHTCGGNLISPYWVLTSSVCILRPGRDPPGPIEGNSTVQHSATIISPTATVNISQIAETINHPNFWPYQNNSFIHDVTLLRLTEPVYVSRYALLPRQFEDIAHGTPSVIAGWGYNETNGAIQAHLQEADVIIFSDEECRNRHEEIVHPSHICAGLPEGGRGGCSGDAGSPLLVNDIVVGLGSWSVRPQDCGGTVPGVYTQVSYYREWIRQITGV